MYFIIITGEKALSGKNLIRNIITIFAMILTALLYLIFILVIRILFTTPTADSIIHKANIGVISIFSLAIVICFIIMAVVTMKEFNYMKLYANELTYNGLSEALRNATLKRKDRFKNKFSVGYVGSVNILANFLSYEYKYDEAIEMLEEFDLVELKDKMGLEKARPMKDNIVTYFGLLDNLMSLYCQKGDTEKADMLYELFNPLYNAYIHKYDYLTDVLYEAKIKYCILKGNISEADSLLDILKTSSPVLYAYLTMEKFEKTGYEEDALNSILEEANNNLENRVQFKKYYSDLLERKKKELTDKQV